MANNITITRTASFSELLTAFLWLTLAIIQKAAQKAAQAVKTVYSWLTSVHDYSNEEGEIHMTGWQFVGFGLLVSIVAIVLSIQF